MGEWKSNMWSEGIKICFCFPSYKHDSATCCMIKKQFQHSWCGRWLFPAETNPLTVEIGKRWWFKYEDIHLDAPAPLSLSGYVYYYVRHRLAEYDAKPARVMVHGVFTRGAEIGQAQGVHEKLYITTMLLHV